MTESEKDAAAAPLPQPARTPRRERTGFIAGPADSIGDLFEAARARLHLMRRAVLKATPAFIVNNASNFISAVHLVGETWMLKSSGVEFMKKRDNGPTHPLLVPADNFKRALTGEDHFDRLGVRQNRWGVLSTTTGIGNWSMGLAVPEGRDDHNQIDEMVELYKEHKVKYFFKRAAEGFYWFNPQYKRQQIGLGVTFTGVCSFLSGFTNVNTRVHHNFSNLPHSINGLLTIGAGLQLWFATNRENAWSRYGATMSLRTVLLPWTIHEKQKNFDGNWGYYAAGASALQTASFMSYFIGGAEKRKDGTIVDHKSEFEAAKRKYGRHTHEAPEADADTPSATVSQVSAHDTGVGAPKHTAVGVA